MTKTTTDRTRNAQAKKTPKLRVSQSASASEAIAEIDALGDKLAVGPALDARQRRAMGTRLGLPTPFIEAIAAMTTRHGDARSGGFDPDRAREVIAYAAAYAPVAAAARELAARIESEIAQRRSEVSSQALATYAMWKGLTRTPAGADLRDSVQQLRAMLRRPRRGVAKVRSTSPSASPAAVATKA